MQVKEYKAPEEYSICQGSWVFLAGSIEQGKADDWQKYAAEKLVADGWNVLNPRREVWDAGWVQSINNPKFKEQVNWELDGLDAADIVLFYFDPATMSPISLLELGFVLGLGDKSVYVVCPEGFWRKGNIEVVCSRHPAFHLFETIDEALEAIHAHF